jgi:CRISPR/Cas system CSM-associated protein Csm3 (group 7 of RAMP superfamily)
MARQISKRIKITGTITAQTPLHVGGLGTDPTVDLSLAVDGRNRSYIPGTSLAGAFRNWMEDCGLDVNSVWGFQQEDQGHASFIMVEDALVTLPDGAIAELRDHVGINRVLGSASDQTKFDRAILPKGSHFKLEMAIDTQDESTTLDDVGKLIDALQKSDLRLGAAKTRGLGLIKLTDLECLEYDLSNFDGMIAALKSGQDGVSVDILPLVSRDRNQVAFVLPGSAVKGAMRSQSERILRTVLRLDASPTDKLQAQLEDPSLDLAHWLFGQSGTGGKTEKVGLGRGALAVDDCFCEKKLNPAHWQAVEQATDDPQAPGTLRGSLDAAGLTETQQAFHVAIDRWTGGAADQMLYSALEPFNLAWEPIELSLDLNRIDEPQRGAVQALLFLTLRDLALGRIPLGYGVNRGYGSLMVEKIVVNDQEVTFSLNGEIIGINLADFEQAWRTWLQQAQELQFQKVAK